jgi:hypothetical protein
MEDSTDTDINSYSIDDLRQLKTLFTQSLDHYNGLLKDEALIAGLKEGDLLALRLCLKETEDQIKEIDTAIEAHEKK